MITNETESLFLPDLEHKRGKLPLNGRHAAAGLKCQLAPTQVKSVLVGRFRTHQGTARARDATAALGRMCGTNCGRKTDKFLFLRRSPVRQSNVEDGRCTALVRPLGLLREREREKEGEAAIFAGMQR